MSESTADPFKPFLQIFTHTNYETEILGAEALLPPALVSQAVHPVAFHDRHIASNLLLKAVKPAPWLHKSLGDIGAREIADFLEAGHSFGLDNYPPIRALDRPLTRLENSLDTASYYVGRVGNLTEKYASRLIFNQDDPTWFSFLRIFTEGGESLESKFMRPGGMYINPDHVVKAGDELDETIPIEERLRVPSAVRESLDKWVIPTAWKLRKHFPVLAKWEFLIMTKQSEKLLRQMDVGLIKWDIPSTIGFSPIPGPPPPKDSLYIRHLLPKNEASTRPRKNVAKTDARGKSIKSASRKGPKIVAAKTGTKFRSKHYRVDPNHFLQRAWTAAVESDATFIIFNCGRYERIGLRHRETQTLYLSDLIDPININPPPYTRLHLGLMIAVLKDAIERVKTLEAKEPSSKKRKRAAASKGKAPRKRNRLEPTNTALDEDREKLELFENELSHRDLLLFSLDYSLYHSPAPSSFLRIGSSCVPRLLQDEFEPPKRKAHYTPASVVTITVKEPYIGSGAVGLLYRATADMVLDSGEKIERNLVIKFAMWGWSQEKVRNEYDIYTKLSSAGVEEGIVKVHGLFQDLESGMLIMVMDDAGKSLQDRAIEEADDEDDIEVEVDEDQRETFVRILTAIHAASVLHDDIRPENLMIDENNKLYIVDFDCAQYGSSEDYGNEMDGMLECIGWPGHQWRKRWG